MNTKTILFVASLTILPMVIKAQKALPIQVYGLIEKIPLPQKSESNFHTCTVVNDESGLVSVKDAGAELNNLQATMEKDVKDLANSTMSGSYASVPTMPSKEQIAQMQQRAQQMQGMSTDEARQMAQSMPHTNASQPTNNVGLMQELGKAQSAMLQINTAINELSIKASQLGGAYKLKIDKVQKSASCPEFKVPHADIAEPKCDCVKTRELEYYKNRITVEDEYIQNVNELLKNYIPKIKDQIVIIDKAEKDLNYGDATTIPTFKTQAVTVQQQAITALAPLLGIVEGVIKDSGSEYTNVVNINNGHLFTPCQ